MVEELTTMKLTVCVSPTQHHAVTNMVYVNPSETLAPYIIINEKYVYNCAHNADVKSGTIALNAIHRRQFIVSPGDSIEVRDFIFPLNRNYTLKHLTLSAEYIRNEAGMPNIVQLANEFRNSFENHVFLKGQKVINDRIVFEVTSDEEGILTLNTEVDINWR